MTDIFERLKHVSVGVTIYPLQWHLMVDWPDIPFDGMYLLCVGPISLWVDCPVAADDDTPGAR